MLLGTPVATPFFYIATPKIKITQAMLSFSHCTVLAPSTATSQKAVVVECTSADDLSPVRSINKQLTCDARKDKCQNDLSRQISPYSMIH